MGLGVRKAQFINFMKDLDNKKEETKDMQKTLDEMRDRAERAERSVDELKKEKKGRIEKAQTQVTPPVAILEKPGPPVATLEKPGPESRVEEEESDNQEDENTLLQTTGGGVCADTEETDHNFTEPALPQRKRTERKRSSKDKRGESSGESSQSEDRKRDRHGRRKTSEYTHSEDKEKLETMKNEMKNQKKKHEKEIEEMKEELRKKDLEIKNKEEEISSTVKTPPRGKKGVVVVQITEENKNRVSNLLGGMLQNDDGTLSRTPMSETWAKNKNHQMVKRYDSAPQKPDYVEAIPGHPAPTTLDLEWSHEAEWQDVPMKVDGTGAE